MLDNHRYNLVEQLAQENQSLWRIRKMYEKDSEGCDRCRVFWDALAKRKEETIRELAPLVKGHLDTKEGVLANRPY